MTGQAQPDPAARKRIKRAFIAVACGLVLQVAIIAVASEPYPAIMMPGFRGGANDPDGWFRFQSFDIVFEFEGGGRELVTPQQFFVGTPESHTVPIARRVFSPAETRERQPEAPWESWLKRHVFPAREMQNRIYYDAYIAPETVEWLRRRAALVFPDRRVQRVRFEWYHNQLRFMNGKAERTRHRYGIREVDLS